MSNKLEILVNEPALMNRKLDKKNDIKKFKNDLEEINKTYVIKSTNIGAGADWPLILITISTLSTLFFLGDKINKNLEAWIKLSKKFKKLLNKIRRRGFFIDSNGATLIALNDLLKKAKVIESIELVKNVELSNYPVKSFFLDKRPTERIDSKPYRFFIKIFLVNKNLFHIYGIKSDGKIKLYKQFSDEQYEFWNY